MSTETADRPGIVIAHPETEDTHYGVPVAQLDEGDLIALGHHGRRKALAAFNRHARTWIGWPNVADNESANAEWWLDRIDERWGVFASPDPGQGQDPEATWHVTWCSPETPGAQPVTRLLA